MKWQLIETAPKDGTLILLSDDPSNPVVPGFCIVDKWYYWDGNVRWLESLQDDLAILDSWWEGYGPKYWMHLPEPPKE
jgi:hypothetical protein